MANNRLTWQNVATPSFETSASALENAGRMTGSAFDALSAAMAGVDQRQRDALSNQAMAEAMKYTDSAQWMDALKAGGIAGLPGLGTDVSRLNADAMNFLQNRTTDLLGNENTRLDMANTQSLMDNRAVQTERDKQTLLESRYNWDRTVKANNLSDATKADTLAAQEWVAKQAAAGMSPTDLSTSIQNSDTLSAAQKQIRLDAIGAAGNLFQLNPMVVDQVSQTPEVQDISSTLATHTAKAALAKSDPLVQAVGNFSQFSEDGSLKSVYSGMLTNLGGLTDPASDEQKSAFNNTIGDLISFTSETAKKFDMPEPLVAALVQRNLTDSAWPDIIDGSAVVNKSAVLDELKRLQGSGELDRTIGLYNQQKLYDEKLGVFSRKASDLQERYAREVQFANDPAELQKIEAKYKDLYRALKQNMYDGLTSDAQKNKDAMEAAFAARQKADATYAMPTAPKDQEMPALPSEPTNVVPSLQRRNDRLTFGIPVQVPQNNPAPTPNFVDQMIRTNDWVSPIPSIFNPVARRQWINANAKTHHEDGRPKRK